MESEPSILQNDEDSSRIKQQQFLHGDFYYSLLEYMETEECFNI